MVVLGELSAGKWTRLPLPALSSPRDVSILFYNLENSHLGLIVPTQTSRRTRLEALKPPKLLYHTALQFVRVENGSLFRTIDDNARRSTLGSTPNVHFVASRPRSHCALFPTNPRGNSVTLGHPNRKGPQKIREEVRSVSERIRRRISA